MSFWKPRSGGSSGDATSRRRGGRADDAAAEEARRVKKNLTDELSKAVKKLLEDHLGHQGPILSSETANNICNVLEAIFMHGFKGARVDRGVGWYRWLRVAVLPAIVMI